MQGRGTDIEVKLLLFAIQKTTAFEKMLAQRFASSVYLESVRLQGLCDFVSAQLVYLFLSPVNAHQAL